MAKKHKKKGPAQPQAQLSVETIEDDISGRGKRVIGAGIALLVLGFCVLTRTDPGGRNWASHLSPFLILGAYAVIAAGIMLPEQTMEETAPPPPDAAQGPTKETPPTTPSAQ